MKKIKTLFQNIFRRQEGYMTIEITIIFPAVFFSLIIILFMGIVLYQEVNLQSLAVRASERGAVVYTSRVSNMTTGIKTLEDFKIRDPYRNVPFMSGGDKKRYMALVNEYVSSKLDQGSVLFGIDQNEGNYVQVEDYLIAKRIKVTIHAMYHTPADGIARMFGQEGPFDVNTTASSAVADSPDFVRNVDIVIDIASQTQAFDTVQDGYNKIREAIEKVADLLK